MTESHKLPRKWVLWYHKKDCNDWSIKSYCKLASFSTAEGFWTVMNSIGTVINEMFFLMADGVQPTYEEKRHVNGGAWLYKVPKTGTDAVWLKLSELLVTETLSPNVNHSKHITGISVSPKFSCVTIRIWNDQIDLREKGFQFADYPMDDITLGDRYIYQAHNDKNKALNRYKYQCNSNSR